MTSGSFSQFYENVISQRTHIIKTVVYIQVSLNATYHFNKIRNLSLQQSNIIKHLHTYLHLLNRFRLLVRLLIQSV